MNLYQNGIIHSFSLAAFGKREFGMKWKIPLHRRLTSDEYRSETNSIEIHSMNIAFLNIIDRGFYGKKKKLCAFIPSKSNLRVCRPCMGFGHSRHTECLYCNGNYKFVIFSFSCVLMYTTRNMQGIRLHRTDFMGFALHEANMKNSM